MPDPRYKWNATAGRYVNAAGRFVSGAQVKRALSTAVNAAGRRMGQLSLALREGRMTLPAWQREMRQEIKNVHLYSVAHVRGGWAQMSQADLGRAGQRIREQYKYLDRFAADLASGKVATDGRFLRRTELYGQAGRQTHHLASRADSLTRGYTQERSTINPGENCDGCLEEAARGWVKIGELVPIGSRDCSMNCNCTIDYQ